MDLWMKAGQLLLNYCIGRADDGEKKKQTNFYKQFRVSGWINDPSCRRRYTYYYTGRNL